MLPQVFETVYLMVSTPAATPVTTPEIFTEAMVAYTVLQLPPDDASFRLIVPPRHTEDGPLIGVTTGTVFTEMILVARALPQPAATAYIMVSIPLLIPVTTPVTGLTDDNVGKALVQVPPDGVSVMVMDAPIHTDEGPMIGPADPVLFTTVTTLATPDVPHVLITV